MRKHKLRYINNYFSQKEYEGEGVWYKIINNFVNNVFSQLRTSRINIKIGEQKAWAERIFEEIFTMRIVPHVDNLKSETQTPPYYTYIEINTKDHKDRNDLTDSIRAALYLHQSIRKFDHEMYRLEDEELLTEDDLLYLITRQNQKICRNLNKIPKMPRVFVRYKNEKIEKLFFA